MVLQHQLPPGASCTPIIFNCSLLFAACVLISPLDLRQVADSDGDDEDHLGEEDTEIGLEGDIRASAMDVDDGEEREEAGLKVQEIDAYWLQRRIAKALAEKVRLRTCHVGLVLRDVISTCWAAVWLVCN